MTTPEPLDPTRLAEIRSHYPEGVYGLADGVQELLAEVDLLAEALTAERAPVALARAAADLAASTGQPYEAVHASLLAHTKLRAERAAEQARVQRVAALIADAQVSGAEWITIRALLSALDRNTEVAP